MTRSVVALSISIMCVALLGGCHRPSPSTDTQSPQIDGSTIRFRTAQLPAGIRTATVRALDDGPRRLAGRIVWNEERTVRIYSPFDGRVERIHAELGEHVKAGQALAILDSPDYGSAQADFRKAAAERNRAVSSLERARDLYEHGVISEKELQENESTAIDADAEARRTERVMQQFRDTGDEIDQRLILRSPIVGVVVERAINPGQEVRTDQSGAPLFVVTDPTTLWLELDAHEDDLDGIKAGDAFQFYVSSNSTTRFHARVLRVADYVDPNTRTIKLLADTRNTSRQLKGEMFVTALFQSTGHKRPTIPATAALLVGDRHYAFVKDGDGFTRRQIEVGVEQNGSLPVLTGLKLGDEVVAEGALFLDQLLHSQPES